MPGIGLWSLQDRQRQPHTFYLGRGLEELAFPPGFGSKAPATIPRPSSTE